MSNLNKKCHANHNGLDVIIFWTLFKLLPPCAVIDNFIMTVIFIAYRHQKE